MSDAAILDQPEQIAAFRLSCLIRAFDMEMKTGLKMTRNMPRVKDVKAAYRLECGNSKASLLEALKALKEQVDEGTMDYEIRDGICHFYPGAES